MTVGTGDLRAISPAIALAAAALAALLADAFTKRRALVSLLGIAGFAAAILLALRDFAGTPVEAFDGLFVADRWTAVSGAIAAASALLAFGSASRTFPPAREKPGEFLCLLLLAPVGMILLAGARHVLVLVLGIETLSIAFYVLAAFDRLRPTAVEAGLKYFLLGSFALGLLLYGSALLFGASGSFHLGSLGRGEEPLRTAGACLLLVGLLFKISAAPFHFWTPDVYEGAPTPVVPLLAAGTKAAALAAIFRWSPIVPESLPILASAAGLTMVAGNLGALVQGSAKRLLAYSAVGHAGVLLVAAAAAEAGDGRAAEAALFYLAAYAPMTVGSFAILALHERETGSLSIDSLRGLAGRRPVRAAALALFLLSLGGLPPTGGFFGKLFVFASAVRAGLVPLAVVGVLLSVVGLAAYLRIVGAIYLGSAPREEFARAAPAPGPTAVAFLCAAAVLLLGLFPGEALDRLAGKG